MEAPRSSRLLLAVSCALAGLLVVLALLQQRWAWSVAQADVERSLNHLHSAATLLTRDFDLRLAEAYTEVQDEYFKDHPDPAALRPFIRSVSTTELPAPEGLRGCSGVLEADPPRLVIPLPGPLRRLPGTDMEVPAILRCLQADLDLAFIRDSYLPGLVEQYFGKDARDLRFDVRDEKGRIIFGQAPAMAAKPEIRESFLRVRAEDLMPRGPLEPPPGRKPRTRIFVRAERKLDVKAGAPNMLNGFWTLEVYTPAGSTAAWAAQLRNRNLLLSFALDLLLFATALLIVLSARRLEAAAAQKIRFVAGVSHELRNPLAALNVLSRNQADGLVRSPEQVREYGALMHQQVERLSGMVEQTLEFAGVHSGWKHAPASRVNVAAVAEAAIEARRPEIEARGFVIETDLPSDLPPVLADPQAVEKAVGNLLGNALKYSRDDHWVRVSAALAADGRQIALSVEDHGIGIDRSERARLFEPFFRGERVVAAQIPGNGLGLSLVRSAIEAMGGSIAVESEVDRGSKFTIHLPAEA